MEEAADAVVQRTGYNLRPTAARSRRWAAVSLPGEQTATALEQLQRGVSQDTHRRVSISPRRQGRDENSEEGIGREVLPLRRANRRQNFQQRPDRNTVATQTPSTGQSQSLVHNGEVGNTPNQVIGADIPHSDDTLSTARQEPSRIRHIPNSHNGIENPPCSHVSEGNDTRSHGSEASAPEARGGEAGGQTRNGVDANVTVQSDQVAGRRHPRPRYGWSWTSAGRNEPFSRSQIGILVYRNTIYGNYSRPTPILPEAVIDAEQVHSGLQCSICLQNFKLNETVHKLPCDHIYHKHCIIPWLQSNNTCPLCRRPILDVFINFSSLSREIGSHIHVELIIRDQEVTIYQH